MSKEFSVPKLIYKPALEAFKLITLIEMNSGKHKRRNKRQRKKFMKRYLL